MEPFTTDAQVSSEAKYKAIFDLVNDAISIRDPDTGAILEVNRKTIELYGYAEDEILTLTVGDLSSGIPPYTREEALEKVRAAQKQGNLVFEWLYKDKSGRLFWAEVDLKPAIISGNKVVIAVVHDITDRKRMEEFLRQSEERLRTLADAMPQLVWIADPDGTVDYYNEHYKDYRGITRTGDGTFEWSLVLHEDDVQPTKDAWRRSMETGEVYQIEHRAQLADGTYQWHLSRGFPLRDAQGKIVKWFGTATNIEIVKRAEEKVRRLNAELGQKVKERTRELAQTVTVLERQREVLQTVFDNIPVMLHVHDKEGNNVLVNREFERLLGWSLEELGNMDILDATYPDPDYRKEVWEYIQAAQPGWRDMEATTRSGVILPTSWTNVRLSDGSRIGIGIDVSERRKMEQDVRRLVKAIEQAGEGITIFSSEWTFEYVNPAYEELSGYRRDELMGRNVSAFTDYFVDSRFETIMEYVTRQEKEWRGRQKGVKKSGETFDISLAVTPVHNEKGEVVNFIEVARDITGEVRMQEQLSQSQKLEAIGTLAGGIAHDLKNILTPIILNAEIAMMDLEEDHSVRELLQEIMQAAKMGTDLVKQIVTFSRQIPKEKRPVAIEPVVREAVDFLKSALPSTIDIHQQFNSGDAVVLADPTRIKQVMINLGTNAGHAMRENGGELDVRLTRKNLGKEEAKRLSPDLEAGSYVLIMVRDTGVGMDEQVMQRIFDPFFTTKKHGEGTGMGLSVVHGIVKDHKGAVRVWSRPGKGSTFSVWLPVLRDDTEKDRADILPVHGDFPGRT